MSEKTLDTLIPDIYDVFNKGHHCDPEKVKHLGELVSRVVSQKLAEYIDPKPHYLRLSNLGRPDRQVWYDIHSTDKEDLPPQVKIKFLFGDVWEAILLFLAAEAGHKVEREQVEVEVEGVLGHLDATIDGVVVDCKSASSYAFRKFRDGTLKDDDPFGYMHQLASYVEAETPGQEGAFLAVNKEMGHLALLRVPADDLSTFDVRKEVHRKRDVLNLKEPPPRCYEPVPEGKSGNLALSVGCSYCGHKQKCWADANGGVGLRTFLYSNGPKHLVHVEREPNVQEITF